MLKIRQEEPADLESIRHVNELAFGRPSEADLVDALRANGAAVVSLVAVLDSEIVGHILFSLVTIDSKDASASAVGLAPVSVLPEHQRKGFGGQLICAGLDACRKLGHGAVFLLGHPKYYPRFGFVPSTRFAIRSEYDAPEEAFMAKELQKDALANIKGIVHFRNEFNTV